MKWYFKNFTSWTSINEKKVLEFLNSLSDVNIPPERIKIVGMNNNWVTIYYYATKEI